MRLYILFFLFLLLFPLHLKAQSGSTNREQRILLVLDGSAGMQQSWKSGESRFVAATGIIRRLMDSLYLINDQVAFGLRVYGNQSPASENNCYDTRQEVMFSKDNRTQMAFRLENLHPMGVSPVSFALTEASENELNQPQLYSYNIILITSDGESCGGSICSVIDELVKNKTIFKTYLVSLADNRELRQQYTCAGDFLSVANESDIGPAITKIANEYRRTLLKQNIPYQPLAVSGSMQPVAEKKSVIQVIDMPLTTASVPTRMMITPSKQNIEPATPVAEPSKPLPTVTISFGPPEKKNGDSQTPAVTDSGKSYLLFTSSLNVTKITLVYMENGQFQPVDNTVVFKLPMVYKLAMNSGRYRVIYTVSDGKSNETEKSKEFYLRSKMNNTIDLD